jgi:hypothetical protein
MIAIIARSIHEFFKMIFKINRSKNNFWDLNEWGNGIAMDLKKTRLENT